MPQALIFDRFFSSSSSIGWNVEWIEIDVIVMILMKWNQNKTFKLNVECLNEPWTNVLRWLIDGKFLKILISNSNIEQPYGKWNLHIWQTRVLTMTKSHNGILNILKNRQNNNQTVTSSNCSLWTLLIQKHSAWSMN